jgi:formylglycine-generating enzyme required for sulfatase activity
MIIRISSWSFKGAATVLVVLLCCAGVAACKGDHGAEADNRHENAPTPENTPHAWWHSDQRVMWQRYLAKQLDKDIAWALTKREPDLKNMVKIPAGETFVGSHEFLRERDQALPETKVRVDGFYIDKTEITNRQYSKCVKDRKCLPLAPVGHMSDWDAPDRPAILNPVEALRYCLWAGKRLPTENEWEKAAHGEKGSMYPWGDEAPTPAHANICGDQCVMDWANAAWHDGYAFTSPVGAFPAGNTPRGLKDMSGNVKEWVQSAALLPEGHYVARGASWYSHQPQLAAVYRQVWSSPIRLDDKGARCAADREMDH